MLVEMKCNLLILLILLSGIHQWGCMGQAPEPSPVADFPDYPYLKITDLRPGDILVKPNHNWIPGTSPVPGGTKFGHAAIVLSESNDTVPEKLLSGTILFESHARDVPPGFQLRKVPGYLQGTDFRYANLSFSQCYAPYRYRLRANLTDKQIAAILKYITDRDNDESSWRALKKNNQPGVPDKKYWYCSLLIWQAFKDVLKMDLDGNGGVFVFPNDLINSHFFDNKPGQSENRVRF